MDVPGLLSGLRAAAAACDPPPPPDPGGAVDVVWLLAEQRAAVAQLGDERLAAGHRWLEADAARLAVAVATPGADAVQLAVHLHRRLLAHLASCEAAIAAGADPPSPHD